MYRPINDTNGQDGIDTLTLVTKKAFWSAQRSTLAPHGLNKRQEFQFKKQNAFQLYIPHERTL